MLDIGPAKIYGLRIRKGGNMSYGAKKKRIVNGEEVSEQVYQEMLSDDLIREKKPTPAPAQPEEEDSLFEKIKKKLKGPNLGETITNSIKKRNNS